MPARRRNGWGASLGFDVSGTSEDDYRIERLSFESRLRLFSSFECPFEELSRLGNACRTVAETVTRAGDFSKGNVDAGFS